jgi:hypothetical protein
MADVGLIDSDDRDDIDSDDRDDIDSDERDDAAMPVGPTFDAVTERFWSANVARDMSLLLMTSKVGTPTVRRFVPVPIVAGTHFMTGTSPGLARTLVPPTTACPDRR